MEPCCTRIGRRGAYVPLVVLLAAGLAFRSAARATTFVQPLLSKTRAKKPHASLSTRARCWALSSSRRSDRGVSLTNDLRIGASTTAAKEEEDRKTKDPVSTRGVHVAYSGLSPDLRWITDPWCRGVLFSVKVDKILHDVRSKFQRIQVLETHSMGRMLVLDNALQCAERDEAGYHEYITHVALCRKGAAAGSGKRALIIGGGDGGAAREILRHDDFANVDLVDIDAEVMAASKKFLPRVWRHPTSSEDQYVPLDSDTRLTVHAEDGLVFLSDDSRESYDVIVVDASDPVGPGAALYSDEFYALLRRRLKPKGAVAVQGGSFWYLPLVFRTVFHGLKKHFPEVRPIQCFTAIYPGGLWNIQLATFGDDPQDIDLERAKKLCSRNDLVFYSPQGHHASFALPPVALQELAKPRPTLSDTQGDLESIMAYGDYGDNSGDVEATHTHGRDPWEPDVKRSLSRLVSGTAGGKVPLAAFDADGTLWDGDSAEIFMEWMDSSKRWSHHGNFVERYYSLLERGDKKGAYGFVAQLFDGMRASDISELCEESFHKNVEGLIISEMKELVRDLQVRGWRVVIVTASPAWIVEPGARRLGLGPEDVFGVEVEMSEGKATSTLRHPLPVREGKVEVLQMAFDKTIPTLSVGNSLDDVALLGYAQGFALVSNPNTAELESLARDSGWGIHHIEK